jgi:small-conductance mechanosensitive channel
VQENNGFMDFLETLLRNPMSVIIPLAVFAAVVISVLILRRVLFRLVRRWAKATDSHLDVLVIESLRGPIVALGLVIGVHSALDISAIPERFHSRIETSVEVLWVLALTVGASQLAGNVVRFYGSRVTGGSKVASLTRKVAQLTVAAIGIVWLLRVVFNINLAPVLTTLGVGGVAVALALQDTLSNLFAGFWVSISGLIHIGDYVKLTTGEEGFVTDIAWRCTTMRGVTNNLVVIPNSKLGQAIYTNFDMPEHKMRSSASFGVGYDSDIDRVQAILLDETMKATAAIDGMLADPAPSVLFELGDSSLNFQVNFSISRFSEQARIRSQLRALIFKRLLREGITMPFPTRTILLESKNPA